MIQTFHFLGKTFNSVGFCFHTTRCFGGKMLPANKSRLLGSHSMVDEDKNMNLIKGANNRRVVDEKSEKKTSRNYLKVPQPDWIPIEPAPPYRMSSPSGSSVSSEDSFDSDGLRDPFFVTLHFITDPGQSSSLKHTIQPLIEGYDPTFKLFNIAERSRPNGLSNSMENSLPALAVVLFMQYTEDIDDNRIVQAQSYLAGDPWKLHHSSNISGKHVLCEPNFQNFYTTETEMPLWAVRQVHYGSEHLRFMIYSSAEGWEDMIQFYSLLLGRNVDYQRKDFCYFLVHSKNNLDIQLAIKKVPHDHSVRPLNSAFLQFKVREAGELVPLLPHACSPISPQRWQTTDPDGNVTLLLISRKSNMNSGHITRRESLDALHSILQPKPMKAKMARTLNSTKELDEKS